MVYHFSQRVCRLDHTGWTSLIYSELNCMSMRWYIENASHCWSSVFGPINPRQTKLLKKLSKKLIFFSEVFIFRHCKLWFACESTVIWSHEFVIIWSHKSSIIFGKWTLPCFKQRKVGWNQWTIQIRKETKPFHILYSRLSPIHAHLWTSQWQQDLHFTARL